MKNYLIALLIALILIFISSVYKLSQTNIFHRFPVNELNNLEDIETPFFLVFFFSEKNCAPCLEVIEVLNRLPKHFKVIGIVPERELSNEKELRNITGANFKLIGHKRYNKFIPQYAPTIVGVSQNKKVLFVLPSVPEEEKYLVQFLTEFYHKAYPLLIKN